MDTTPHGELVELLRDGLRLSSSHVNARLRSIWPHLRAPQHGSDRDKLVALFRHAGYVSDGPASPKDERPIFQGRLALSEPSISWTLNQAVATKYARGYTTVGDTEVWQAKAPPAAVLAQFAADEEIVVDPALLKAVKRLGYFRHLARPI